MVLNGSVTRVTHGMSEIVLHYYNVRCFISGSNDIQVTERTIGEEGDEGRGA